MGRAYPQTDRKRQETALRPDSPAQIAMDFTPDLLEQFPAWADVIKASVYGCGRPFKAVASDLDMTVSDLSRKMANNPTDPAHFPLDRLPELIAATGDTRPIEWLVLRFQRDPEEHKRQVMAQLAALMPVLTRLAAAAGQ